MPAVTIRIPIDLRNPRSSSMAGQAFWTPVALTALDLGRWEMVQSQDAKIYGVVAIPADVNATPNAKIILAIGANTTSGVARLSVATKAVADAETMNPATLTGETAQDITVPATARLRKDVTFGGPLSETLAANDVLLVEVFHEGAHANDTLTAANLELYDAWLEIDVGS